MLIYMKTAPMKEHGIRRIYTRDIDFNRFPSVEAIDPLKMSASDSTR